ncbi:sulfotransferase family 2 domain-containing protein [Kamptonema sp. UHCC 0994]|uniref:sulfotransferase family 2 domain-containing protein n=1 Tax=Kamptonema sp. UHCC 0994 TaxID=3031329 RepID=UPI0023B9026B|nr:sulfotransferase family 2 domain-containing protein [Kamptonema sp. UHCC 0994]MDF0551649.1 sulfotransferase family 2 domain-containing protein [Kamptonema sp. UHCC 0994]
MSLTPAFPTNSWFNKQRSAVALEWVLLLPKYNLLYVETPKAACTKIRTLLILLNRGNDDPELAEFLKKTKPSPYYHWEFGITDNYNLSKTELFKVFQESQYFKFTFVRNPYDKLVSAYANKIMASPSQNSYYQRVAKQIKAEINWNPSIKSSLFLKELNQKIDIIFPKTRKTKSIERPKDSLQVKSDNLDYDYDLIANRIKQFYGKEPPISPLSQIATKLKVWLLEYPDIDSIDLNQTPVSFEEFIKFICNQNVENLDEHWQPQTFYMGYEFANYDFVGRVENFDQDIQYVFNQVKAPEFLYRHIKGKMNVTQKPETIFWTDELAEMVYEKYQSDFETFGYEKESYEFLNFK